MFSGTHKKVTMLCALALVIVGVLIVPAGAGAKGGGPFKIVAKLHFVSGGESKSAGTGTVTVGGKTYKGVAATGSVTPPKLVTTFSVPGGSITTVINNGKISKGVLVGSFTLKGSGKYRNISGSGKLNAPVTTLVFTFTGTASL